MAWATPTLGGVTLPNPVEASRVRISKGDRHERLDGSVVWDHLAYKYRWTMHWAYLTGANRDTLKTRYEQTASQTFVDWDGVSGSVSTLLGSWQEEVKRIAGTTPRYSVTLTLEEV